MKDFQLRNDTRLLFREDLCADISALTVEKKVLFVHGSGSSVKNGCYADVKKAVESAGGVFRELFGACRERTAIEKGIRIVRENGVEMVIGAGGASCMDCAKLIAFSACYPQDWWEFVKGKKGPYGLEKRD